MSCPTCDHTMQSLGITEDGLNSWWCPRCGTLRQRSSEEPESFDDEVPQLVARCREVAKAYLSIALINVWHQFGIGEAINKPDKRRVP